MSHSTGAPLPHTVQGSSHRRRNASGRKRKGWVQSTVGICRTVHIYLTMLGLFVMVLFGATGFTINHESWFGATSPRLVEYSGTMPAAALEAGDRLAMVEYLRSEFGVNGAVTSFDDFGDSYWVSFKQPGDLWEAQIAISDGAIELHHEIFNFTAIINNLHRGRYTGEAWRWIIDLSAILIFLACLTGFVLWLVLPRRRKIGVAMLAAGVVLTMLVIYFLVPGRDAGLSPPPPLSSLSVESN